MDRGSEYGVWQGSSPIGYSTFLLLFCLVNYAEERLL